MYWIKTILHFLAHGFLHFCQCMPLALVLRRSPYIIVVCQLKSYHLMLIEVTIFSLCVPPLHVSYLSLSSSIIILTLIEITITSLSVLHLFMCRSWFFLIFHIWILEIEIFFTWLLGFFLIRIGFHLAQVYFNFFVVEIK